jgi:hypothetical protein
MKSNPENTDDSEFTWWHISVLVMAIPLLYFASSIFVIFLGMLFSIRSTYAYYLLYSITAILTGILGAVYLPSIDSITATRISKGMMGGWVAVFVYTLFATRFRTVSGISTQMCENASLFGILIMPSIVAGLSGWLLYETIVRNQ